MHLVPGARLGGTVGTLREVGVDEAGADGVMEF